MLLRRRLLLLFLAIVVGVLALGAATVLILRNRDDAQQKERVVSVAGERVAQLGTAYADQETGERGFVITGESAFLEPYRAGRATATRLDRSLRATDLGSGYQRDLRRVTRAIEVWHRQAAEPEIELTRTGGPAAASERVASGTGRARFDDVRQALATLDDRVQRETTAAEDDLDGVRRVLTALFVSILALSIIGAIVAAWLIRRWITRPIDSLAGEVRRVRAGSLDSPIRIVGPPELASLAVDVDAMRWRIREQLAESERSREAVEQSAAVVLTLRSQLEPDVRDVPDGWSVAGRLRAAVQGVVAGDCYDIFTMSGRTIALIVVDIAGHGATEGILALRCKEMLRTALVSGSEPGVALDTTAQILGDMGDEVFLTAFVAVIDTATGHVRYANAGHPPACIVRGEAVAGLEPTGPIVGLLQPGWTTAEAAMAPGDTLCAYTDGVIETRSVDQEFFGSGRLIDVLRGARGTDAQSLVLRCIDEVEAFAPDGLRDDVTIVVLCRSGESATEVSTSG